MRTRIGFAFVGALSLLGCGNDRDGGAERPPTDASTRAPSAPEPVVPATPAWDDVRRTFAAVDVPGFTRTSRRGPMGEDDHTFVSREPNAKGTTFDATVYAGVCDGCKPVDAAVWSADPSLRESISPKHRENPALVLDVYALDLFGKKAIAVFKESAFEEKSPAGAPTRSVLQSLDVEVNDGKKRVGIFVNVKAPDAWSVEALRKRASKADFEGVARAVFARYASSF